MDMKKVYVKYADYQRSMMTLRNYVTAVIRCENTFKLRNQQMEDDTGVDIIDSLQIKFSIAGSVHLQLFNAIAILNCSSTVQQQNTSQSDVTAIYFALIG